MAGDARARANGVNPGLRIRARDGRRVVAAVAPGGPAATAGIREGDLLLQVDGRKTEDLGLGAIQYLLNAPAGAKLSLRVQTLPDEPRTIVVAGAKP